jgi:hypothetical protein
VDPVPDSLLLRKSGSAGNRTDTSRSVARNSDHQTTEAVLGISRNGHFYADLNLHLVNEKLMTTSVTCM